MSDIKTLQEEAKKLGHDITGKNMAQLKKLIESGPAKTDDKPGSSGGGDDDKGGDKSADGAGGGDETKKGTDGQDGAKGLSNGDDGGAGGDEGDADKAKENANDQKKEVGPVKARLKCYNVVELPSGRTQYEFEAVNPADENASFCNSQSGAAIGTLALVIDEGTDAHETLELGAEVVISFEKPE